MPLFFASDYAVLSFTVFVGSSRDLSCSASKSAKNRTCILPEWPRNLGQKFSEAAMAQPSFEVIFLILISIVHPAKCDANKNVTESLKVDYDKLFPRDRINLFLERIEPLNETVCCSSSIST